MMKRTTGTIPMTGDPAGCISKSFSARRALALTTVLAISSMLQTG
jgi:hypothetical protein